MKKYYKQKKVDTLRRLVVLFTLGDPTGLFSNKES